MQALKKRLATLGFIGLVTFALLPAGLSICGPGTAKLRHHVKKLHASHDSRLPALKAQPEPGRVIVRDVLPEENRELKNPSEEYASARSGAEPPKDGSHAAWATLTRATHRASILNLHSVLKL